MRRIFLDIGADVGESVEFFRKNHPEADQFEIFSFEPHPENIKKLRKIEGITLIEKAVWVDDGGVTMYFGKPKSSTICSDKRTGRIDPEDKHEVPTIDLAKFMKDNFKEEDEVWMKMNIEGAEYVVLPHLKQTGALDLVDRLYIKWHLKKIPSVTDEIHDFAFALVPQAIPIWRCKEVLPLSDIPIVTDEQLRNLLGR